MSDTRYLELCQLFREHDFNRMTCYDHNGHCCPGNEDGDPGCHDITETQNQHYATEVIKWQLGR